MQVSEITLNGYSERVKLNAVYGGGTNAEDNTFAQATPSGTLELCIDNPKAQGQLKPGMKFYVDLTPAPEPAKQV